MKITPSTELNGKEPVNGKPAGKTAAFTPTATTPSDKPTAVTLSPQSAVLSQVSEDLNKPQFDAKKVEEITNEIRKGTFKVNPEAVADKLLASTQDLLAAAPKPKN